jgi:hypothetical protein
VKAGIKVVAADPATGKSSPELVTRLIVTRTDTDFTTVIVKTAAGRRPIVSTTHHLYWDVTIRTWTAAGTLHDTDKLHSLYGKLAIVAAVHSYTTHAITYNLTVNDLHTYYVLAGSTPVLVHNATCPLSESVLSSEEMATAQRLMKSPNYDGGELSGYDTGDEADVEDSRGQTYDFIGQPGSYSHWNPEKFFNQLDRHLYQKTFTFTVVDFTGATQAQIQEIEQTMAEWEAVRPFRTGLIVVGKGEG